MQDAVPPAGTAWVVTRMIEESEGHTRSLRPLSYMGRKHLLRQRCKSAYLDVKPLLNHRKCRA
jgi:hypothetical protein